MTQAFTQPMRTSFATQPLCIAGVDEAGRGPLAGPVCAAAVVLALDDMPEGLADSKTLSEAERDRLFPAILAKARGVSFSFAPPDEIDRYNIRMATLRAMKRAVEALPLRPDRVLIDGRDVPPGLPCPGEAIIGGDACEPAIAAASIVAKVMRDRLMLRLDALAPVYGFARHKGYGTSQHRQAIRLHGASPWHRLSFAPFKNGTN